jgi:hypothetical protein
VSGPQMPTAMLDKNSLKRFSWRLPK